MILKLVMNCCDGYHNHFRVVCGFCGADEKMRRSVRLNVTLRSSSNRQSRDGLMVHSDGLKQVTSPRSNVSMVFRNLFL